MNENESFAKALGCAALNVWGDMPRDVQEALFEIAVRDGKIERDALARLLHERHPRTFHPTRETTPS